MNTLDALKSAYRSAETVVAGVRPTDYSKPTPCGEWDVRALTNHLIGAIAGFPVMLRGEQPNWSADLLGDDPVASFKQAVENNLNAWAAPGAVDQPTPFMPSMHLIDLNLCDAVVHTWDLATATGQAHGILDEVIQLTYEIWKEAPLDLSRKAGAFGPEVAVPESAPTIDRLVGLLGRRPNAELTRMYGGDFRHLEPLSAEQVERFNVQGVKHA